MIEVTERRILPLLPGQVDADAAREIVASVAGHAAAVERVVYYPYYRFETEARVRALVAERPIEVTCLVDARRGFASTADRFDVVDTPVDADCALDARLAPAAARRAACAYLRHALTRRFRTIADFGVEPGTAGMVYRKFWLLRCDGRVTMVDSVTGSLHVVGRAA